MRRARSPVFLSVLLAFGLFEGGGTLDASVQTPKRGGVLRIGLRRDITNLHPYLEYLSTNALVKGLVYEGLTAVNDHLDVVPSLAESWSVSKDGKEYQFHLRRGVLFHHGKELNAEDVKWSLEYVADPKNRAYMQNSVSVIEKVEATGKHSVRVWLKQPFAPLLAIGLSTDTVIVPKNSLPPAAERLTLAPPGTGPFKLAEWKRAIEIRQVANRSYWNQGIPYLAELIFKPVPSADVRFLSLRSGDLDLVEEVPYHVLEDIRKEKYPDIKLAPIPIGGFRILKMNAEGPYFNNAKVRKAVAYAVDRKAYIEGAFFGHGEPAYHVNPKGSKWHFEDVRPIEMDLEKARTLLAEAGYPRGFKSFLQVRQGEEAENALLQGQLRKVGIDLEMQVLDSAQLQKNLYDGTGTLQISGSGIYADIDRALYTNFHSEVSGKRTGNHTGYKNLEVDRLLEKARAARDPKERQGLYKRVTEIITEESPEVNFAFITRFYGYRNAVKGFTTNLAGTPRLHYPGGGIPMTWIEAKGK
jgi:ABC-type transport system substrate-binding protein